MIQWYFNISYTIVLFLNILNELLFFILVMFLFHYISDLKKTNILFYLNYFIYWK